MIVKKLESPIYQRRRRHGLAGRGVDHQSRNAGKSFDQYLLEAFQGEVVQEGNSFSRNISARTRENLIHLSRI